MSERRYEVLLIAVIAARASSFIFTKMLMERMESFNILSVRFLISFAVLCLIFLRRFRGMTKQTLNAGIAVGLANFLMMAFEMLALETAATSFVSLVEHTAIIIVPTVDALLKRRMPTRMEIICPILAMAGVTCILLQESRISVGMIFALLAALSYSASIILMDRMTGDRSDAVMTGVLQIGVMGMLSLIPALTMEHFRLPSGAQEWSFLAVEIIVCTIFGFTLQPLAQEHVPVDRTGVICAVNPAVAALLGATVLHEKLGPLALLGLVLILLGIMLPHLHLKNR